MNHIKKPSLLLYEDERALKSDPNDWSVYNAHDPSIFKDGDTYYILSTDTKIRSSEAMIGGGCQLRTSKDLIEWQWHGLAFDGVPEKAFDWTGAKGLWAPEVCKWGGTYYLYYCASQFGKNRSFIGLATSDSMNGDWEDQGEVYKTSEESAPNAIDPNIVFSKEGLPYLVYGSFFGGIFINELDPDSGKLKKYGDGKCIAKREKERKEGAVEGPYLIYHHKEDMYYLFVSYDSLFSNYHIRVGRSKNIEGPYLDFDGRDLADATYRSPDRIGMKLLAGYQFEDGTGWMAPGHNSVLENNGEHFIVHHARLLDKPDTFCLHVRRILWTSNGWPLISIERYAGERVEALSFENLKGNWEAIKFDQDKDGVHASFPMEIRESVVTIGEDQFNISSFDGFTILLTHHNEPRTNLSTECKVIKSWDWEKQKETVVLLGLDSEGIAFSAKLVE